MTVISQPPVGVGGSAVAAVPALPRAKARTPRTVTPDPPCFRLGYRPALDGVRGIAILAVLFYHLLLPIDGGTGPALFRGGFLGVDIFFVLSGFLITSLLLEEHDRHGTIDLRRFWVRRALRLLPALFLVVAATFGMLILARAGVFAPDEYRFAIGVEGLPLLPRWAWVLGSLFPVSNWLIAAGNHLGPVSVVWSLAVEDQFYLAWPIALLLLLRLGLSRRVLLLITAAGVLASAAWRLSLFAHGVSIARLYNAPDTRADSLLTGCALALLASLGFLPTTAVGRRRLAALAVPAALVLGFALSQSTVKSSALYQGGFTVVALAVAVAIAYLLAWPATWATRFLSWWGLVGLGQMSYGVYLWHGFISWYAWHVVGFSLRASALTLVGTAVVASGSYYVVERPFLRLKRRFEPMPTPEPLPRPAPLPRPTESVRRRVGPFAPLKAVALLAAVVAPLLMAVDVRQSAADQGNAPLPATATADRISTPSPATAAAGQPIAGAWSRKPCGGATSSPAPTPGADARGAACAPRRRNGARGSSP